MYFRALGFLAALYALQTEAPQEPSTIELPRGGWRQSAGESTGYLQPVYYPASTVNTENANPAALISGHIKSVPKLPPTLVVNGTPMPVHVDENGSFARPWAFGS